MSNPGTTNLVSYWKLDESSGGTGAVTRNDSHGANHLTDNNTTASATGILSNCADFVKTNSEFLSRGSITNIAVGDFNWSFVAWVNPDAEETTGIASWVSTTDFHISMLADRRIRLLAADSGGTYTQPTTTGVLTVGGWNFVVVIYDAAADELQVSINGAAVESFSKASIRNTNTMFRIGLDSGAFSNALIDEASFRTEVLTADHITWLYNAGSGRTYEEIAGSGEVTVEQFLTSLSRIQILNSEYLSSISRILKNQSISTESTARILKQITESISSTGRIQVDNTELLTSLSNIIKVSSQHIDSVGRIEASLLFDLDAIGRIQVDKSEYLTSTSNIIQVVRQYANSIARIEALLSTGLGSTARIQTTAQTYLNTFARIQISSSDFIESIARILTTQTQGFLSSARINKQLAEQIQSISNISVNNNEYLSSLSRILASDTEYLVAISRIQKTAQDYIASNGRIQVDKQAYTVAVSRISAASAKIIGATASIFNGLNEFLSSTAAISTAADDKFIQALARISLQTNQTITATANILIAQAIIPPILTSIRPGGGDVTNPNTSFTISQPGRMTILGH